MNKFEASSRNAPHDSNVGWKCSWISKFHGHNDPITIQLQIDWDNKIGAGLFRLKATQKPVYVCLRKHIESIRRAYWIQRKHQQRVWFMRVTDWAAATDCMVLQSKSPAQFTIFINFSFAFPILTKSDHISAFQIFAPNYHCADTFFARKIN